MKRESNASKAYDDVIRSVGSRNKIANDNTQALTGETKANINCRYCIDTGLIAPSSSIPKLLRGYWWKFKIGSH